MKSRITKSIFTFKAIQTTMMVLTFTAATFTAATTTTINAKTQPSLVPSPGGNTMEHKQQQHREMFPSAGPLLPSPGGNMEQHREMFPSAAPLLPAPGGNMEQHREMFPSAGPLLPSPGGNSMQQKQQQQQQHREMFPSAGPLLPSPGGNTMEQQHQQHRELFPSAASLLPEESLMSIVGSIMGVGTLNVATSFDDSDEEIYEYDYDNAYNDGSATADRLLVGLCLVGLFVAFASLFVVAMMNRRRTVSSSSSTKTTTNNADDDAGKRENLSIDYDGDGDGVEESKRIAPQQHQIDARKIGMGIDIETGRGRFV